VASDEELVRTYLGEPIPEGGSDADTLFSHADVTALLARSSGDVRAAAVEGWAIKAAHYAGQVDVSDGTDSRQMSQLHRQAVTEWQRWSGAASPGGGTRIHQIRRREQC
jgi:hypothetical protein